MAVEDPFDTSDMQTARHHLKRLLVEWRDAGAPVDSLVMYVEAFVACKVSEMMQQHTSYLAQETPAESAADDCMAKVRAYFDERRAADVVHDERDPVGPCTRGAKP